MIPTPIGLVVIVIGLWLLFRPAVEMLSFVVFCALFSGASAADMPVLGHSSIPPATLALGFLALRACRRDVRSTGLVWTGARLNLWFLVFCVYGALTAFVLPRIFAGRLYVIPMQKSSGFVSLFPSSQNLTQAVYLCGSGAAAVLASTVCRSPKAAFKVTSALILTTWVQVATGIIDAVASLVHLEGVLDIFRNGAYAQLDQDAGNFHRIAGLAPEASSYASLGLPLAVFCTEAWLRGYQPKRTGPAAVAMFLLLAATTSSTAYAGLAAYGLVLVLRVGLLPRALPLNRVAVMVGVAVISCVVAGFVALLRPNLADAIASVLVDMTVNKGQSLSGQERSLWAKQGWELFVKTRGLGVGVGSFRSSSLFTAVLGSMGPAALLVLTVYCLSVLKPLKSATYTATRSTELNVGVALSWAVVLQLVPAAINAAGADPGVVFAVFAGAALAMRRAPVFSPKPLDAQAADSASYAEELRPGIAM